MARNPPSPIPLRAALAGIALLAAFAALASPARADSAALLPVRESARVPERVRLEAANAAVAALVQGGVSVRNADDTAALLIGDPLADCATVECAGAVAQRVGADFVVVLSVFGTDAAPSSVAVALATADGLSFGGEADVTSTRPLTQAVAEAVAEARVRQGAGTRGTLRVTTTPAGATVHVDGRFRGETPLYRALEPGPHVIVVSATGRVTQTHDVVITLHGESALELTLEEPAPVGRTRSPRAVLGPLVLGVVGLGLLTVDAVTLGLLGKVDRATDRQLAWAPFLAYGVLGIGALVTGLLWFLLSGGDEAAPSSLTFELQPESIIGTAHLRF